MADIVDGWIDLLIVAAGLRPARRLPDRTDRHRVGQRQPAGARRVSPRFAGWSAAVAERLRADGWPDAEADQTALAVIALIEGALILSRIAGDDAALNSAKVAARSLSQR